MVGPRKTDMRSAMNAILYLLRTGCPWRYLPRDGFPPRSTVYNIFRKFQGDGTWHAIWDQLYPMLREREDREGSPSAGIIDSQTIKSAEKGAVKLEKQTADAADAVGYEPGKKVKGRKIHSLVDTLGLPIRLVVHSAGLQDRDGAGLVFDKIKLRFPWLECVFADTGYNAQQTYEAAAGNGLRLEVVRRNPNAVGFEVIKRRWVVERTFSWLGRNRRLAKDFENLASTLLAFVTLAAIQFGIRRLARS